MVVLGLSPGLEMRARISLASMYSSSLLFPSVSAIPSFPPWQKLLKFHDSSLFRIRIRGFRPVLGIRDIVVRIRISGNVPYLWLKDPDLDPTPDPTHSSLTLKMQKINFFQIFFLQLTRTRIGVSSVFKAKRERNGSQTSILYVSQNLIWQPNRCTLLNTSWLMDPALDPGGSKTCGSCGSGSPTLI